jgi:pimeloyl-ACP methyl ester carboxylesterase
VDRRDRAEPKRRPIVSGDRLFRTTAGATAVRDAYRRLIDEHLPWAEQRTVPTASGDTFVLSTGPADGPPILLLHGSGSVAASWAPEMIGLGRTHRVHAIDLPGESGRSAPQRLPLRRGAHAQWLHEASSVLAARPAAVAGISLGGWVALDYAVTYPDAVRELVLFSPSGIGPRRIAPLLVAALLGTLGDRGRRRALTHLLGPGHQPADDSFHRDLGNLALTTFRHFRPRTDPIPHCTDDELRTLPRELTVVLGARDRMLHGPAAAQRLQRHADAARIDLLPRHGHLVPRTEYLHPASHGHRNWP